MTREEQIREAFIVQEMPIERPLGAQRECSFIAGAQWADANPKEGVEMWMARDEDGKLNLFNTKPMVFRVAPNRFISLCDEPLPLQIESFSELTFGNSPQKVRITLIN